MNNISPIYSMNNSYLPAFKQNAVNNDVVSNPIITDVSMDGLSALSNYNSANININRLKELQFKDGTLIDIPNDITKIPGKRIYDEDGRLFEIIDEDEHYKYVYKPELRGDFECYTYQIIDKKNNELVKMQMNDKEYLDNPSGTVHYTVITYSDDAEIRSEYDSNKNLNMSVKTIKPYIRIMRDKDGYTLWDDKKGLYQEYDLNGNLIRSVNEFDT